MILATGKFTKKFVFLFLLLFLIAIFAVLVPPSNIVAIIIMNILISSFLFFTLKTFLTKKLALSISLPIFLILILFSLKLFDLFNLILVIALSIAVGLLIR